MMKGVDYDAQMKIHLAIIKIGRIKVNILKVCQCDKELL